MNRITALAGAAILLVGTSVQAQGKASLVPVEYSAAFRVSFPGDWTALQDMGAVRMIGFSPQTDSADNFRENLNVTFEGLTAPITLSQYVDSQIVQLRGGFVDFSLIESADRTLRGRATRRIVYEHNYNGRRVRVLAYMSVTAQRAYVLTATALSETFDTYLPVFEKVMETFEF